MRPLVAATTRTNRAAAGKDGAFEEPAHLRDRMRHELHGLAE